MKLSSIPQPKTTFKSWYYTLKVVYGVTLTIESATMYYNGGYSPKATYAVEKNVPAEAEIIGYRNGIVWEI